MFIPFKNSCWKPRASSSFWFLGANRTLPCNYRPLLRQGLFNGVVLGRNTEPVLWVAPDKTTSRCVCSGELCVRCCCPLQPFCGHTAGFRGWRGWSHSSQLTLPIGANEAMGKGLPNPFCKRKGHACTNKVSGQREKGYSQLQTVGAWF